MLLAIIALVVHTLILRKKVQKMGTGIMHFISFYTSSIVILAILLLSLCYNRMLNQASRLLLA